MQTDEQSPASSISVAAPAAASEPPASPPRRSRLTPQRIVYHAAILLAVVAVLFSSRFLELAGTSQVAIGGGGPVLPGVCFARSVLGVPCPSCGLTRSFVCLVRGNVAAAWQFNPASLLVFGVVLAQIPYRAIQIGRLATGKRAWQPRGVIVGAFLLVAVLLAQWLWRLTA